MTGTVDILLHWLGFMALAFPLLLFSWFVIFSEGTVEWTMRLSGMYEEPLDKLLIRRRIIVGRCSLLAFPWATLCAMVLRSSHYVGFVLFGMIFVLTYAFNIIWQGLNEMKK